MRFQRLPGVEFFGKFTLAESGVNFSMADSVNQGSGFTALASGHQVMFIHTQARLQQSAAQRAVRRTCRLDIAQRFSAAKGAFGNHLTPGYFLSQPFNLNCQWAFSNTQAPSPMQTRLHAALRPQSASLGWSCNEEK